MRRYNPFVSHALEHSPPASPSHPPQCDPTASPPRSPAPRVMRKYLFPGTSDEKRVQHTHCNEMRRRHSSSAAPSSPSADAPLKQLMKMVDAALGPVDAPLADSPTSDRLYALLFDGKQQRQRVLSQFLRARHADPSEALAMILDTLRWRNTMPMDNYLLNSTANMQNTDACFPMHIISTPHLCKQPVVYGLIRLLDKRHADKTAFQNALLSFLESIYYAHTYVLDEMVVILDFRDWSIRRNAPYRLVKDAIQTLQDYYPERLGRVFLVNYPTSIRAAYTAISPIIDAGAKEKIVWVPDDPSTVLHKFIAPKSIPTFLGGHLNATFPPSWPDIAAEFQTSGSAAHSFFG